MGRPKRDEAFEALFYGEFRRCEVVARRITGDASRAEDLTAEAFARAWARWSSLRTQPWAANWVLRVTVNLAIDVTRKQALPITAAVVLDSQDVAVEHLNLVRALRELPRRQREVVALRYLADLSEAKVATTLGVSAGSVKTHLSRGLARLRGNVDVDEDDLEVRLVRF